MRRQARSPAVSVCCAWPGIVSGAGSAAAARERRALLRGLLVACGRGVLNA